MGDRVPASGAQVLGAELPGLANEERAPGRGAGPTRGRAAACWGYRDTNAALARSSIPARALVSAVVSEDVLELGRRSLRGGVMTTATLQAAAV